MKGIATAWRRLDVPGHDCAVLLPAAGGWRLEGMAVFVDPVSGPCGLSYRVETTAAWHTRSARVVGWAGGGRVDLRLAATPDHRWSLDGRSVPEVDGCVDVDLAFTPATNLLPIRRLDLPVGGSSPVAAAWLRFPELDLRRLDQTYTREAEARYDYRSGDFRAALEVTREGFVSSYEGLWAEVGAGR